MRKARGQLATWVLGLCLAFSMCAHARSSCFGAKGASGDPERDGYRGVEYDEYDDSYPAPPSSGPPRAIEMHALGLGASHAALPAGVGGDFAASHVQPAAIEPHAPGDPRRSPFARLRSKDAGVKEVDYELNPFLASEGDDPL